MLSSKSRGLWPLFSRDAWYRRWHETQGLGETVGAQRPELVRRLDPEVYGERLYNLISAWSHEIQEVPARGRLRRYDKGFSGLRPRESECPL